MNLITDELSSFYIKASEMSPSLFSLFYTACVECVFCAVFLASSLAAIQDLLPGLTSKQCNREVVSPPLWTHLLRHTHAYGQLSPAYYDKLFHCCLCLIPPFECDVRLLNDRSIHG